MSILTSDLLFNHTPATPDRTSPATSERPQQTTLLGMPLNPVTENQALAVIEERLARKQGTWVLTPNLDILRQYCAKPELRHLFHADQGGADLLVADGMPLVWASRIAGRPVPERVPGSGLVFSVAERAAKKNWSIFLLGGSPGAADAAAKVLQERYPGLKIAGTCCPKMGFDKDPEQMSALRAQVKAANPDIVYVALGFPKQEMVTRDLRTVLPAATFLGVGISLSFICGEVRRAPRILQRLGLEWMHRLVQEPRRLASRYLVHDMPFALFHLFPQAVAARWHGEATPAVERPGHFPASTEAPIHTRTRAWNNPRDEGLSGKATESARRPGHHNHLARANY